MSEAFVSDFGSPREITQLGASPPCVPLSADLKSLAYWSPSQGLPGLRLAHGTQTPHSSIPLSAVRGSPGSSTHQPPSTAAQVTPDSSVKENLQSSALSTSDRSAHGELSWPGSPEPSPKSLSGILRPGNIRQYLRPGKPVIGNDVPVVNPRAAGLMRLSVPKGAKRSLFTHNEGAVT